MQVMEHGKNWHKELDAWKGLVVRCKCGCKMQVRPPDIIFKSSWQRNIPETNSGHIYCPECFEKISIADDEMFPLFYDLAKKWFESTWHDK